MYSIIGQGQLPLHNNDLLNIVQLDACFCLTPDKYTLTIYSLTRVKDYGEAQKFYSKCWTNQCYILLPAQSIYYSNFTGNG